MVEQDICRERVIIEVQIIIIEMKQLIIKTKEITLAGIVEVQHIMQEHVLKKTKWSGRQKFAGRYDGELCECSERKKAKEFKK